MDLTTASRRPNIRLTRRNTPAYLHFAGDHLHTRTRRFLHSVMTCRSEDRSVHIRGQWSRNSTPRHRHTASSFRVSRIHSQIPGHHLRIARWRKRHNDLRQRNPVNRLRPGTSSLLLRSVMARATRCWLRVAGAGTPDDAVLPRYHGCDVPAIVPNDGGLTCRQTCAGN